MSSPYQLLPFSYDYQLKRVGAHALEKSVVVAISQKHFLASMKEISRSGGYYRLLYGASEAILGSASEQWIALSCLDTSSVYVLCA